MKTVKTFSNLSEAGFASSLLEAAGIPAFLADEQSYQYSYGMATGGIRLQVEEEDFERAGQVLEKGPDADVETPPVPTVLELAPAEKNGIPTGVFVAITAVFCVLLFVFYNTSGNRRTGVGQSSEHIYSSDDNHDGRPDRFRTYRNGKLAHVEIDRNFDGRIDEWIIYDSEGRPQEMRIDNNFDGQPDEWYSYRNGVLDTEKIDSDFNGRPDWFVTYKDGIIAQANVRPNESAVVTRRYIYEHGVLREEYVDENGDGKFDYKILHDPFGATSEKIPIESPK